MSTQAQTPPQTPVESTTRAADHPPIEGASVPSSEPAEKPSAESGTQGKATLVESAQSSRRRCVEYLAREAQRSGGLPPGEVVEKLRAGLAQHAECKKHSIGDGEVEAVVFAARTPVLPEVLKKRPKELPAKKRPPLIHSVKPSEDFLKDYVDYADYLETPKEAHQAAAMTAIAATANGNIAIMNGSLPISFDLWTVILKKSGAGANSLLRPFHDVLEEAGLDDVISGIGFGSNSQAMQHFAVTPRDLIVLPEMSATLDDWKHKQYDGMLQWLTNLYDEFRPPSGKQYRDVAEDKQGRKRKTPDIEFEHAPRTCILGMSAESWFFRSMQQVDLKGGFWPRFVMERIETQGKLIPTPHSSAQGDMVKRLAARLQQIAELKGEMCLSQEGQRRYEEWYAETAQRFAGFSNQAVAEPIWKRHRVHLFKFAAVYQLSVDPRLEITPGALERAIEHAKRLEPVIVRIAGVQLTHNGEDRSEIEDFIKKSRANGQPAWAVFRNLRGKSEPEKSDILRGLLREEVVFRFERQTAGRPGQHFVHASCLSEYQKAHPTDKLVNNDRL